MEGGGQWWWWGGRTAHGVWRDALRCAVLIEADRVGRHRVREELLLKQPLTDGGHPRRQLLEVEAPAVVSHGAATLLHTPAVHLLPHGLGRGAELCGHLQLLRLAQVVGYVVDRIDAAHAIPLEVQQRRSTLSAAALRQREGRQGRVQPGVLRAVPRPVPAAQEEVRPRQARRTEGTCAWRSLASGWVRQARARQARACQAGCVRLGCVTRGCSRTHGRGESGRVRRRRHRFAAAGHPAPAQIASRAARWERRGHRAARPRSRHLAGRR